MTTRISLDELNQRFTERGSTWGLRAPFDQAKKYNPAFNVDEHLKQIPQAYLNSLVSLNLAMQKGAFYEIDEYKIGMLARRFAPVLVFDSKEKQDVQLGNLKGYLKALFSKQYALVKDDPSEKYKKFVESWIENPTPKQFLQFLNVLTDHGKTALPLDFFQESLKAEKFILDLPSSLQIYTNFIPGEECAVIQYYTFYPTNDQNRFFTFLSKVISCVSKILPNLTKYESVSFHLADWERADVYIRKTGGGFEQIAMTYPGHGAANIHKTEQLGKEVFVGQGGHPMRPSSFPIDLMFDNCDGRGSALDLSDRAVSFIPISLHHLLTSDSLETRCLTSVIRHGPGSCPKSAILQRFYAASPASLEYIRLNKAWQPDQPIVGCLWRLRHPATADLNVPAWDPSFFKIWEGGVC